MGINKQKPSKFNKNLAIYFIPLFIILSTTVILYNLFSNDTCNCQKEIYISGRNNPITVTYNTEHKLAIIVPFRDRFEELLIFAPFIHDFLNDQKIDHDIFVINQIDGFRFNRASLINIGYLFTKNNYDYIAMHDVDLLPLNKNLRYTYPHQQPFHVAAPNLHPRYHYSKFIGGILLINRDHYDLVNGMSNKYWGWGLEDDEFYVRLRDANLNISRPVNISTGVNDTFKHIHDKNHRKRDTVKCFNQREVTRKRDRHTGLHDVKYKIHDVHLLTINGVKVNVLNVQLFCDHNVTPWCDCNEKQIKS